MLILGSRVLVKFDEVVEKTKSGLLIIPGEARDPAYTGTVLAIGPEQVDVRVGDRVVFSRYAGVPIDRNNYGKPELVVVDSSEILAVFWEPAELVHRETIAIDIQQLKGWLDIGNDANVAYVQFSHQSNTLYVTTERVEKVENA